MKAVIALSVFLLAMSPSVLAATPDNVVIADAYERYRVVDTPSGYIVKAEERTEYEATRHSATVVPHCFYSNDISLDKASGGKPQYKNINSSGVFHNDSYICFFELDLKAKGAKAKAEFKRTFKNFAHFAKIGLSDIYPTRSKLVKFEFPASCSGIELAELNFPKENIIRNDITNLDGSRVVTFAITDLPGIADDKSSPPAMVTEPFILIKGYFSGVEDLYDFHRKMLDVDTVIPDVSRILAEAAGDAKDRRAIIAGLYKYVQSKIRYVANEEGEAGYRPDVPAEVIRKQYGDCKGMALLLATLLNRAGVDASVACIGTKHIPFDIADYPSLAATDHMICIAPAENDTLYLDATYEYISSCDIPFSIQGKDAIMFTAGGYKLIRIPRRSPDNVVCDGLYEYDISEGCLTGHGRKRYTGDMLEAFLSSVYGLNRTYKEDVLELEIRPRPKVEVIQGSIEGKYVDDGVYELTASLTDDNAVVDAGDRMYVDLNTNDDMFVRRIDPVDRRSDYEFMFPVKIICKSVLNIPDGYSIGELPEVFHAENGNVELVCEFVSEVQKVAVVKTVTVNNTRMPLAQLADWNNMVAEWNEVCSSQIELIKNK